MKTDFIIVGNGLAGSLLAWNLLQFEKKVVIIDEFNNTAASQVSAGIFLPVTGRRIVRTWMADELLAEVKALFSQLGTHFGETYIHEMPVVEIPASVKEWNEWQNRASSHDIGKYINCFLAPDTIESVHCPYGAIELKNSGYVNISACVNVLKTQYLKMGIIHSEKFNFNDLQFSNKIIYKNIEAHKIIFCEGADGISNPFFNYLPYQLSKGEILTIRCNTLSEKQIINHGIFILPIGNQLFRVGSTYEWNDLTTDTTESARNTLTEKLHAVLKTDFEIVDQKAGIRPSVKERRPFIGIHPKHKNIGIFNGLGTKGIMLAPYFSKHFASHLAHDKPLMADVDIARFS
ncbi:MAG: FAD-dependent oxidoreductase [Bacteroidia bacterium]